MMEIKTPLLHIRPGETYAVPAGAEDDAMVITDAHTHADIIRYVVADIGEDALFLVKDALSLVAPGV